MPKKSHELDDIDLEIIDMLMEDARMPCREIAARIGGTTERTVRYRIQTLYDKKIISTFLVPNHDALGLSTLADVFIDVEPGRVFEVANRLSAYDCISYVGCSMGDNDISVQIVAKDNADLYDFTNMELGRIPGVKNITVAVVPVILKISLWKVKNTVKGGARAGIQKKIQTLVSVDEN
jgi:Lrp/AsnC family transcriptional regulator, regulator for asnA, asnC and gidA